MATGEHAATDTRDSVEFDVGDFVVYPHHGAGKVLKKEIKEMVGEKREYLTIQILHNDMTVMVPSSNAGVAGLRRVIDEEEVEKVLGVLRDDVSQMPKNWNERFKHNRDKIKTGDVYELAEVVRNLTIRASDRGLSTDEKQMYTRAKKILASELMYALEMEENEAEQHLDNVIEGREEPPVGAAMEAARALRERDEATVKQVLRVLASDAGAGPRNWRRRFKFNERQLASGDIFELAEVVRNLNDRRQSPGLVGEETAMYQRAKGMLVKRLAHDASIPKRTARALVHRELGTSD